MLEKIVKLRHTGAKVDQCIRMNKTSQSSSSKIQSDYSHASPSLTPHPDGHSQLESTDQSLYELTAMFEHTSLYLYCHS